MTSQNDEHIKKIEELSFEELEKQGLIPFAKFGDNLLAGTVAGVETDEDGNIVGFDPEMFVAGLGGYTIAKQSAKYLVNNFGDKLKKRLLKKLLLLWMMQKMKCQNLQVVENLQLI